MGGSVALVSPGLAKFPDPEANQLASFTAGDAINTKNDHIDLLQRQLIANGDSGKVQIVNFGDVSSADRLHSLDQLIGAVMPASTGGLSAVSSPFFVLLCCSFNN